MFVCTKDITSNFYLILLASLNKGVSFHLLVRHVLSCSTFGEPVSNCLTYYNLYKNKLLVFLFPFLSVVSYCCFYIRDRNNWFMTCAETLGSEA